LEYVFLAPNYLAELDSRDPAKPIIVIIENVINTAEIMVINWLIETRIGEPLVNEWTFHLYFPP
jgi:hypothetical protein